MLPKLILRGGLWLVAGCYGTPSAPLCPGDGGTPITALEVTPRADRNLELLALHIENADIPFGNEGAREYVARQETYDRVVRDVTAARALEPELENVTFSPRHDGRTMRIVLSKGAFRELERGEFHELDCFFDTFGGEILGPIPEDPNPRTVLIQFDGVYDLTRMSHDIVIGGVPGIPIGITGRIDETGQPIVPRDGPTICVQGFDATWHYVFVDTDGPCEDTCTTATNYYITTEPNGQITLQDTFEEGTTATPPGWMTSFRRHAFCGGKPYSATWM